ncbi:MAG: transposase [Peptostreptococcaceae bacterium]|nr:transposase [Peptostreptococcaceae bacterium]
MEKDVEYRTVQIRIKKTHSLFQFCDNACFASKNLYNVGNFHIRQIFSGLKKEPGTLHQNETDVFEKIEAQLEKLNAIKLTTFDKQKTKASLEGTPFSKKEPTQLMLPNKEKSFLGFNLLDGMLKLTSQPDYIAMPAQVNQQTLKLLYQDWKSFFEGLKAYKKDPSSFTGRPRIPNYAKKNGRKVAIFTNQNCTLKVVNDRNILTFPKTKLTLDMGTHSLPNGIFKESRIVPESNFYAVELIFAVAKELTAPPLLTEEATNIIGIDLGVNNFATISNNIGVQPIVVKGGILKARNQWYNKRRAYLYGVLRAGKTNNQGPFTSKNLNRLDTIRHLFMKDYFHKASRIIINYCIENGIDTIVLGKNVGWKQSVHMNRPNKQNFSSIPYEIFIAMLDYKAREVGIRFVLTEESYTSKASFLDRDVMPVYGNKNSVPVFSGKRIKRGLYQAQDGTLINADVNGSFNIIRKVFPNAFTGERDRGYVNSPKSLLVA